MKELSLPMSRVKTIMKSSPHVDTVGQDGLFLVAKATEMFIHHLTEEAHMQANKGGSIDYKHLAEVVQTNETLEFLKEIMPRKITVRQFKELMAAKDNTNSSSSESSSDSDSDSQSDSDSCSDSSDPKEENDNSSGSETEKKPNGKSHSSKSDSSSKSESEEETKN